MALGPIALPALPGPPSWFPGHMMKFTRMLPSLLSRTDVVLEIRDARLPLTSINRTLEGALKRWRLERGWDPADPRRRIVNDAPCEHVVILNKHDLVPQWGVEPFRRAMAKSFPGQHIMFASWQRARGIAELNKTLVGIAKNYPTSAELNVLVIGMPNVGKSTLLNHLRNMGISGRTPKAFQTSAQPGLTRALSTRLKLSIDPPVYAYDTPGVMLPFLGHGAQGAERGVKLALIAGIKESLYDPDTLAGYLLYRLNALDPERPAYLTILPTGAQPTTDLEELLESIARRMGMLLKGGIPDYERAARFFIKWWREEGGLLAATGSAPSSLLPAETQPDSSADEPEKILRHFEQAEVHPRTRGWGFDFQWEEYSDSPAHAGDVNRGRTVQAQMEKCIADYLAVAEREEGNISSTQRKKMLVMEEKERRRQKQLRRRTN